MTIPPPIEGEDALIAALELAGRTGATGFEIGYLHDDVPIAEAGWYASAQYRGARITCEDQTSPVAAAEGLASRLLTGAKCTHCGKLISLDPAGAYARDTILIDGTPWLAEQQATAGICVWHRDGRTWRMGCEHTTQRPSQRPSRPARRPNPKRHKRGDH